MIGLRCVSTASGNAFFLSRAKSYFIHGGPSGGGC
jgi:hypothetical protein